MKRLLLVMLTAFALLQLACYKDKGNYDYHEVVKPQVTNFDSIYYAFVGDTLIIKPTVMSTDPKAKFGFSMRIGIPQETRDTTISGYPLKFYFSLPIDTYPARLTITDSSNGMKYFMDFQIQGVTQFTKGALVLSQEGNTSQLSFVKPDNTVMPRIYQTLNGADLPGGPLQVIDLIKQQVTPVPTLGYWATFTGSNEGGMQVNTNTLLQVKTLRENFFDKPAAATPGYLETSENGVLRGVVNGKLYMGSWQTYWYSDVYGYFGTAPIGDYQFYRRVAFNNVIPYGVGYDMKNKQFAAFTNFGSLAFSGANYQVTNTTAFDPKNIALDLIHFQQINDGPCYAFGKAADGTLYELRFLIAYMGFIQLSPDYKRPFAQPGLITPTTKWTGSKKEVFYFTSGDKIYRYNPTNQSFTPLTTDFGGKAVTMIKLSNDENTLMAGVDGTVYFLDISTGKNGDVLKKYTGIPGSPVDITVKQ
ncbi:MAG: PKD-like family lipoprotein [Niastella sp.]|uniref:PKD-like family lipoprotein n=1 Tax=Niastella sp. TaxID=1869183 RepID=UPI00389A21F8